MISYTKIFLKFAYFGFSKESPSSRPVKVFLVSIAEMVLFFFFLIQFLTKAEAVVDLLDNSNIVGFTIIVKQVICS